MMVWIIAALLALVVGAAMLMRAATSLDSEWFGKAVRRLPAGTRRVALTFDDGPSVPYSGQILDFDPIAEGNETSFEPYVTWLKRAGPEIVFVAGTDASGLAFVKEARRQQLSAELIACDSPP